METHVEYASKARLLGLPLIHIAVGTSRGGQPARGVARGWVAIGDISFGLLLSIGGLALGTGICFGGVGIGLVSLSGLSVGLLLALGGLAIGYLAVGGAAIALKAALGGLAVARDYAIGGGAFARHANDPASQQFFQDNLLLDLGQVVLSHSHWLLLLLAIPVLFALQQAKRGEDQGRQ
jgi:hypothetical protein